MSLLLLVGQVLAGDDIPVLSLALRARIERSALGIAPEDYDGVNFGITGAGYDTHGNLLLAVYERVSGKVVAVNSDWKLAYSLDQREFLSHSKYLFPEQEGIIGYIYSGRGGVVYADSNGELLYKLFLGREEWLGREVESYSQIAIPHAVLATLRNGSVVCIPDPVSQYGAGETVVLRELSEIRSYFERSGLSSLGYALSVHGEYSHLGNPLTRDYGSYIRFWQRLDSSYLEWEAHVNRLYPPEHGSILMWLGKDELGHQYWRTPSGAQFFVFSRRGVLLSRFKIEKPEGSFFPFLSIDGTIHICSYDSSTIGVFDVPRTW